MDVVRKTVKHHRATLTDLRKCHEDSLRRIVETHGKYNEGTTIQGEDNEAIDRGMIEAIGKYYVDRLDDLNQVWRTIKMDRNISDVRIDIYFGRFGLLVEELRRFTVRMCLLFDKLSVRPNIDLTKEIQLNMNLSTLVFSAEEILRKEPMNKIPLEEW